VDARGAGAAGGGPRSILYILKFFLYHPPMHVQEPATSRLMLLLGLGTTLLTTAAGSLHADTPLTSAAAAGDVDEVEIFLSAGLNPDAPDGDGQTPLIWAAREGRLDTLALLLRAGADPNRADHRHHWTPLMHAVRARQTDAARLLMAAGADATAAAPDGLTPLLMAAAGDDTALVELLLAHGADPRAQGPGGETALSQAVSGGAFSDIDRPIFGACRPAVVRLLLARDPGLRLPKNFPGQMARWVARLSGCTEVLELIGEPAAGDVA